MSGSEHFIKVFTHALGKALIAYPLFPQRERSLQNVALVILV